MLNGFVRAGGAVGRRRRGARSWGRGRLVCAAGRWFGRIGGAVVDVGVLEVRLAVSQRLIALLSFVEGGGVGVNGLGTFGGSGAGG